MPHVLNLDHWPRRAAFDHFRRLGHPYFSVCASVDVSRLAERVQAHPGATLFLAYHHAALRALNAVEQFRYRLSDGQVLVHERIDGSTTVLRANQSIGFVTLRFEPDFACFVEQALPALAAAKASTEGLGDASDAQALVYMTTLPWLAFTSFSHARDTAVIDSVPALAFGKITADAGGRLQMPVAVEVHHGLMDGLHVGQFYAALQAALA